MPDPIHGHQQPVGPSMPDWATRPLPARVTLEGRYCRLEPLDADRHGPDLYAALSESGDTRDWTYLPVGPFASSDDYRTWLADAATSQDPLYFSVIDATTQRALGTFALLRPDPKNGSAEVGMVLFSDRLKRSTLATEAQYLLMRYVFDDLGYRRYEWRCDSLNEPSRKAALRLGFDYEGLFRKAIVYKGRSRDTAWFSIIDDDWPSVRDAIETWMAPDNFDEHGAQRRKLQATHA